jgi:hypothetical protein
MHFFLAPSRLSGYCFFFATKSQRRKVTQRKTIMTLNRVVKGYNNNYFYLICFYYASKENPTPFSEGK